MRKIIHNKRICAFVMILLIGLILSACGDPGLLPVSNRGNIDDTTSSVRVSTPVGPRVGKVDQSLTYTISVNTDLGDGCKYGFNWGDGSYTWKSNAIASHSWSSSGIYVVRAQVRCDDIISEWSNGIVVMIGSAAISRSPLNRPDQTIKYITPNEDRVNKVLQNILAIEGKWPHGDFDAITENLARGLLNTGIQKGDSVCAFLNNGPEIIQIMLATAKVGAIFVPINVAFLEKETAYIVNNCNAKMMITESGFMDMILTIRPACPSLKYVVHTSEETDLPDVISWWEVLNSTVPVPIA